MRTAALFVILCLLVSPAAFAADQVVVDVEIRHFLSQLWEILMVIPATIDKVVNDNSPTTTDGAHSPIEPPEGDAGPMVIVNG